MEAFEERIVAEFRSFTSLGEAAEHYLPATFEAARACTAHEADPIWEQVFEDQSCDSSQFVIADEKVKCAMQPLLTDQQQALALESKGSPRPRSSGRHGSTVAVFRA